MQNEVKALEGVKCKSPFQYEWGGFGFHNAIILGTEVFEDETVYVKVVFMHPTSKQMQPCPYFLEGKCKYSDEKCHFSHGYTVKLNEIQDYRYSIKIIKKDIVNIIVFYFSEPDYNQIVEGCTILAKYKDNLWYQATVQDIVENQYSVKFSHCDDVELLDLHSVYPIGNFFVSQFGNNYCSNISEFFVAIE